MKNITLIVLLGILIASCGKTEEKLTPICDTQLHCLDENCQYPVNSNVGYTTFLNCYGHWAIMVLDPLDDNKWYLVDSWDASYEEEGIQVTFCGYARDNEIPILFPDPMPGRFYQIDLENIEVLE